MTQMQGRVPTPQSKPSATCQFQGGKPPAEGIMGPGPKNGEFLAMSIRKMSTLGPNANGAYSSEMAWAAKISVLLDGAAFRKVILGFSDTPSIMAALSLCSLVSARPEAREYSASMLHDKSYLVGRHAAASVVDGFFISDVPAKAMERKLGGEHSPRHAYLGCGGSADELYAALRRSAFVELLKFYQLDTAQSEFVKLNAAGRFAERFEDLYFERRGWSLLRARGI